MKNIFQFLKSSPKTQKLRIALIAAILLSTACLTALFFVVARGFGSMGPGFTSSAEFSSEETGTPLEVVEVFQPELLPEPEIGLAAWDGSGRVTILVMDLDYRDWSSGDGPARTDTMMLLTLDPLSNTAGMLSIPRDLWVSIPGFENGRINTAYFLGEAHQYPGGGAALAVKTVEGLLGVTIHYYAQIDFAAFVQFIDEIGGIKIDVPERIKIDPIVGDPIYLKPERQTLYGELALAYARARNSEAGDLDRAQRQQQVILGIRDRLLSPEAMALVIGKAPTLYAQLVSGIQTNLELDEIFKLALQAQKVPDKNIEREAIDVGQVLLAESPDEQKILVPLPDKIRQVRDEVFLSSSGILGHLAPGSPTDLLLAEGARIRLLNGSQVEGLALRTQTYLQSQGATSIEVATGEFNANTLIVDYTGNPHTVRYLSELFTIVPGNYTLQYDPNSLVDITIILGADWGNNNPLP
jgi:polyisoprenyl-teichoic acid--peptidoglycan teichoic acid transferase